MNWKVCLILWPLIAGAEVAPVDPLWKSESFRRSFTASYGTDARIEPTITAAERAVLDAVAVKMRAEDREGAVAVLTASELLPKSAALLFSLGNLRFEQEKNEDAEASFQKALDLYPSFRDAHRNLAVALVRRNEFEAAKPHLLRALELGAQDGLTMGLLGYVHASAGRHQAALQAYRMAQLTMPEEPQWKLGEALALLALEDPNATVSIFKELIEAHPENPYHWAGQADALHRLGKPLEAIANLEFVRRMGLLDGTQLISLGHLYLNEGMTASALEVYRAALTATTPAPFGKAVQAVDALCGHRDWVQAQELAQAVLQTFPEAVRTAASGDHERLERSLALIELESGEANQGAARVEALIQKDPLDGLALILLARFRAREERFEEAFLLFEQAAREPESEEEALRRHGQLLVERGQFAKAVDLLDQALALRPDPSMVAYLDSVRALAR